MKDRWSNNYVKFIYKNSKPDTNWPLFGNVNNQDYTNEEQKKIDKHIEIVLKKQNERLSKLFDISKR